MPHAYKHQFFNYPDGCCGACTPGLLLICSWNNTCWRIIIIFATVIFREVPSEGSTIAHIHFQPLQTPFTGTPMEPNDCDSDGEALGPTVRLLHSKQDARGRKKKRKKGRTSRKCYARMVSKENITYFSRSRRLLLATGVHSQGAPAGRGGRWMVSRADDELPHLPALAAGLQWQGRALPLWAACGSWGRRQGFVIFPQLPNSRPVPEPDGGGGASQASQEAQIPSKVSSQHFISFLINSYSSAALKEHKVYLF